MFRYLRTHTSSAVQRGNAALSAPTPATSSQQAPALSCMSAPFARWYGRTHDPEISNPSIPKRERLREWKEAREDITVIPNAPHWNEKLASNSEADVKADRSPKQSFSNLQQDTIRILNEREQQEHEIGKHHEKRAHSPGRSKSGYSPTQIEIEYLSDTSTVGWVENADIVERESVHIISVQDKMQMEKTGPIMHEATPARKMPEGLSEKDTVRILTAQDKMEQEGRKQHKPFSNPFSNL